jgi:hypothetical protein
MSYQFYNAVSKRRSVVIFNPSCLKIIMKTNIDATFGRLGILALHTIRFLKVMPNERIFIEEYKTVRTEDPY